MNALFALRQHLEKRRIGRRIFKNMPSNLSSRTSRDTRFMRAMPVIALLLVGVFYAGEHFYQSTRDAVPLRMTEFIEAKK